MKSRGTSEGRGHEDGRGAAGKVWRGKEVKRRRMGEGIGSHGRAGVVMAANKCVQGRVKFPQISSKNSLRRSFYVLTTVQHTDKKTTLEINTTTKNRLYNDMAEEELKRRQMTFTIAGYMYQSTGSVQSKTI
jgi:hypothetical protein